MCWPFLLSWLGYSLALRYSRYISAVLLCCREVMSYPVTTLNGVEKVSHIVDILTNETHDGFPIVHEHLSNVTGDSDSSCVTFGLLSGIISRSQLIVLLRHKVYFISRTLLGYNLRVMVQVR